MNPSPDRLLYFSVCADLSLFITYYKTELNTEAARQSFYQSTQKQAETVQQFVTRLRQVAKDCDFSVDRDNQLRDAILSKVQITLRENC